MDIQADLFNNAFSARGGVFSPENYSNTSFTARFLSFGRLYLKRIKDSKDSLPDVYLDIINNNNMNAVAGIYLEKYYIGIYIGAISILYSVFLKMLSHPNILSEYGDSSKESPPDKMWNIHLTNYEDFYLQDDSSVEPKDIHRFQLAEQLTLNALIYLTMHEYGHIVNGHLGLIYTKTGDDSIDERSSDSIKIDSLFMQNLELDADSFAAVQAMNLIEHYLSLPPYDYLTKFYKSKTQAIALWSFSVCTLFRVSSLGPSLVRTIKIFNHPHPELRVHTIMATIITKYEDILYDPKEDIGNAVVLPSFQVLEAFALIAEETATKDELIYATKPEVDQHIKTLMKQWGEVRKALQPFAFATLAT